jgi:hypothetical protein
MILLFNIHVYHAKGFIDKFKINIRITYLGDFKSPLTLSTASSVGHRAYHNI